MIAALIAAAALGQSCYARTYSGYNAYGSGYNQQGYGYHQGHVDRLLFVPLAPAYAASAVVTAPVPPSTPTPAAPIPAKDDRLDRLEAAVMKLTEALTAPPEPKPEPEPEPPAPEDDGPILSPPRSQPARTRRKPTVPTPSTPAPAAVRAATMPPDVYAALQTHCARCHTGKTARGKFKLFDAPGTLADLSLDQIGAAADAIEAGTMPKHAPMDETAKGVVIDWAQQLTGN